MSSLKKVSINSFFYSASSILQRASSIIFFPIFSAHLSKVDYGILSFSNSLNALLVLIVFIELQRAIVRFIYLHKGDQVYANKVEGTVFAFVSISSMFLVLLLTVLHKWLLVPFLNNIPFYPYIFCVLISLPFGVIYLLGLYNMISKQQGYHSFWLNNLSFALNMTLNLVFVIGFKMDIIGMLLSTLISNIILATYCFIKIFRYNLFKFDFKILKDLLRYALPLIPFALFGLLMDISDNFIINSSVGISSLGLFYIAFTFAGVFAVIKESVNQAIQPFYFDKYTSYAKPAINKIIYDVLAGVGLLAIGVSWFNLEVLQIFSRNKDLVEAHKYIPIMTMGYYAVFISQMVNLPIYYEKKRVNLLFVTTLVSLAFNIALSLLLVKQWGILGTSFSKLCAFAMHAVVTIYLNRKYTSHHYSLRILTLCFIGTGIFCLLPYLPVQQMFLLIIKIGLYAALMAFAINYFNKHYGVIEKVQTLISAKILSFRSSK